MKAIHRFHLVLLSTLALCTDTSIAQAGMAKCNVTPTTRGAVANSDLRVLLPNRGHFLFRPGGPGFITSEGALGIKILWERLVDGELHVIGKRLDGDALPLRFETNNSNGKPGIQPSYLVFPKTGCWEITAWIDNKPLSVVVLVEKKGSGPTWKRD